MKNKQTTTKPARKGPRSTSLGLASTTESRTNPFIKIAALGHAVFGLMVFGGGASSASGATYITPTYPTNAGSNGLPTSAVYTSSLGYAFKTGASGPFDIDWVSLEMTTGASTATSGSFKIAIHSTTNETAYSALAGSTAYATDTVTIPMPGTTGTTFTVNLTSVQLPNIKAYDLLSNTSYSLILYNAFSSSLALRRTTGFADGTTNSKYTVTNGFMMLDTFRNNVANYANAPNVSYPTFAISFGGASAIPEPGQSVGVSAFLASALLLRYRRRQEG